MDSYQAIYDAVRSRISGGNVGEIVAEIAHRSFDLSWQVSIIQQEFICAAMELQRPFMTLKPKLYIDGNSWCALYGDNVQEGLCGFGDTPDLAARDFDKQWFSNNPKITRSLAGE